MPEDWRLENVRWLAHISRALSDLETEMNACGYSAEDVFAVVIALDEAILNAVKHGRGGDPTKCVRVCHRVTTEAVTAEIVEEEPDKGHVANPGPERGPGIRLRCTHMTWVHSGDRGQDATMCKHDSIPRKSANRRR